MTVSYETSGIVTEAGIAAAIRAGSAGPQINVAGFRIGANSAAQGAVAVASDTNVDAFVYQGTVSSMSYTQLDADTVIWRIRLDSTVGNFTFGNVGLVLSDGTLFCKAVLPGTGTKYQSDGRGTNGNTEYINIIMRLLNAASLLNLTFITNLEATLPEVPTELQLPDPLATVFDTYLVDNHTHVGVPTTAVRLNGEWWHSPHRLSPDQGDGIIVTTAGAFTQGLYSDGEQPAPQIGPVGFDPNLNQFVAADSDSDDFGPIGVRTSSFEITTLGMVEFALAGLAPSAGGTRYYAGGTATNTQGQFSTVENGPRIAISTGTDLYVDTTGLLQTDSDGELLADQLALIVLNARNVIKTQADTRRQTEKTFVNTRRLRAIKL